MALLGWALGNQVLVRVVPLPGAGIMMPNTALGLLLCGTALWLLRTQEAKQWQRRLGQVLALVAGLLGALSLAEYVLNADLGIDLLLFRETVQGMAPQLPGRPSPMSSASLCAMGLALLLLHVKTRRGWYPARLLASGVILIATQALIGYVYLEESLVGPERLVPTLPPFTPMAVHTAAIFLALSLGLLTVHRERGLMAVLLREDVGGLLARRLLPAAILTPLVVGGLRLLGEKMGLYGTTFGLSLVVLFTMAAFLIATGRNASALSESGAARQRSEQALQASEERFRTSFEDAPIGMALVSLDGRFLAVNGALCEIVGYSQKELLTKTFQDITFPEDLGPDLANANRLLQGTISSYQMEKRYIHKAGHAVSVLLTGSLVRNSRGEPVHFIAQIQDISERKELERAWRFLAEAGPRLAGSLSPQTTLTTVATLTVPELADWCVVDLLDDAGRVSRVEHAAASPEKARILREMLTAYPHDPFHQGSLTAKVLRTGEPVLLPAVPGAVLERTAVDARHLELLRSLQPLSGMIVPLQGRERMLGAIIFATSESGHRYGARDLALAEELARRAALAIENAHLHEMSEQAKRFRDEVLRIVAHDLRTPLHVVSLSAGMLSRCMTEEGTGRKQLDAIHRSVARATRLIQDLLDVARMEAGQLSVEPRPEETGVLAKDATLLHLALADAKDIQLRVRIPEDCPGVLADRDRVIQILSNLLGNALKFTPKGGQISFEATPSGDRVLFSVSDTGPGIPAEDVPHLFEPFWQARAGKKEGAGLGLAIVKGLVEAHGGRIWVKSRPGMGSTFFFTLPAAAPATEHPTHQV